jgi:hypothetical protein
MIVLKAKLRNKVKELLSLCVLLYLKSNMTQSTLVSEHEGIEQKAC